MSEVRTHKESRRAAQERDFNPSRCIERHHSGTLGAKTLAQAQVILGSGIEDRIQSLEDQLAQRSAIVPIQTLHPHAIQVIQPILAVVQFEDGVYVGTFFDANINSSGESQLDAIEMLKETIASTFLFFIENESVLGSEPRRQLGVLQQFLRVE